MPSFYTRMVEEKRWRFEKLTYLFFMKMKGAV
jgi:hypothetical protein